MVNVVGHISNYPDRHFGADFIWRIKCFLTRLHCSHIKNGKYEFWKFEIGKSEIGKSEDISWGWQ